MTEFANDPDQFLSLIASGGFDHIDFGCSKGGSLAFAKEVLGGCHGLGIDKDPAKVDATKAAGFEAVRFDIHRIPPIKLARFVVLSHFLEHVPNPDDAKAFLRRACEIATEFVYVAQPFFDADGYLARNRLKLYWSDWRGHPNRMTTLELWLILRDLQKEGMAFTYSIHYRGRILDSHHPAIQSLVSPVDQERYDPSKHPDRGEKVVFREPVYGEVVCVISMPGMSHASVCDKVQFDHTVFEPTMTA